MDIKCPHCSRTVSSENINIQTCIAKCGYCGAVFGFAGQVPGAGVFGPSKRAVEMPDDYTVATEGADMVIVRRWFSRKYLFMLFFCVFWDGFLAVWYVGAFKGNGPMMMKLFPLLHVGVGVWLTYYTLAGFVNRTKVTLNSCEFRIKHYPMPWPGSLVLPRQEIDQFFCEEKLSNNRNGASYSYNLSVVMAGGKKLKLVSGLDTPEDALFLEQKIEGFLGITDRPVAGEMRPV